MTSLLRKSAGNVFLLSGFARIAYIKAWVLM
jgi:hypothetical protein